MDENHLQPTATPHGGRGTVLVVDDEPINTYVIRTLLQENGYRTIEAIGGEQGLSALEREDVDILICDIRMPRVDGEQVLRTVVAKYPTIPVIMLTGFIDVASAVHVMRMGASDYLTKPIESTETLLAVERAWKKRRDMIERRRLEEENARQRQSLESIVEARTRDLQQSAVEVLTALSAAVEERDPYLAGHARRVVQLGQVVAQLIDLPEAQRRVLHYAGLLHDVGKLCIGDAVMQKLDPLTPDERALVQSHVVKGYNILKPLSFLRDVLPVVLHHHENFDGTGYPGGLAGEAIPQGARILRILDAFDAMTSPRSWRPARSPEEALLELAAGAGTVFDPHLVDVFSAEARRRLLSRKAGSPPSGTAPARAAATPNDDIEIPDDDIEIEG